jgi:hypothetical protein
MEGCASYGSHRLILATPKPNQSWLLIGWMGAAQNGQRETIRLLLEHGASNQNRTGINERRCILHQQVGTQRQCPTDSIINN